MKTTASRSLPNLTQAADNVVAGNLIGTDATGTQPLGNGTGVQILNRSIGNTIGGTTAAAANVISANLNTGIIITDSFGGDNLVAGNLIGTDATGDLALGNYFYGVEIDDSSDNTIGGTASGALNVISNTQPDPLNDSIGGAGVVMMDFSGDNVVLGNDIGTNLSDSTAMGNAADGVDIESGSMFNTIGGSVSGAGNLIAENVNGVDIDGPGTSGNFVEGNLIGTDSNGDDNLGNDTGVVISDSATDNTIGGVTTAAGTAPGNVITGSNGYGIFIGGSAGDNAVEGNLIGTGQSSSFTLGNNYGGVSFYQAGSGNTIGGDVSGAGNLIGGNAGDGIYDQDDSGNLFEGNVIGLNPSGTTASDYGNGGDGVELQRVSGDTVGGTVAAARNVISGNSNDGVQLDGSNTTDNVIEGNFIGTDISGTTAVDPRDQTIGNNNDGVEIDSGATGNTVGGTVSGALNLISGNIQVGVEISGSGATGNLIEGDFIGTDVTGTVALFNPTTLNFGNDGVEIDHSASGNTVGGTTAQARNVISGAGLSDVGIDSSATGNLVEGNYIGIDSSGTFSLEDGQGSDGVEISAPGNTLGGTISGARNVISGNAGPAVELDGAISTGNLVLGNFIGTDYTGTVASGNITDGIDIDSAASGNTIGGVASTSGPSSLIGGGAGNLISGNQYGIDDTSAGGNLFEGNVIGLDATGTIAVPNASDGVAIQDVWYDTVGGTASGAGNLISGNQSDGVEISGDNNLVAGNFIGTDVSGSTAFDASGDPIGNANDGVEIDGAGSGNTIGGATPQALNVISGNVLYGVQIAGEGTFNNLVEGNSIGLNQTENSTLDKSGRGLGNYAGVEIDSGAVYNTIGGTSAATANVISGNSDVGVYIQTDSAFITAYNLVEGNLIGTDSTGTFSFENSQEPNGEQANGLVIQAADDNTIGGTAKAAATSYRATQAMALIFSTPRIKTSSKEMRSEPMPLAPRLSRTGMTAFTSKPTRALTRSAARPPRRAT